MRLILYAKKHLRLRAAYGAHCGTLALSAGAGVVRTSLLGLVPNGLNTEVEASRMRAWSRQYCPKTICETAHPDRDGPYGHVFATTKDSAGGPAG